jgi:hypothetical protein
MLRSVSDTMMMMITIIRIDGHDDDYDLPRCLNVNGIILSKRNS